MTFEVKWSPQAGKALSKLEKPSIQRILQKVEAIKHAPERYLKQLTNDPRQSLRVGDYRVLIKLLKNEGRIEVLTVGHRRNIYKR